MTLRKLKTPTPGKKIQLKDYQEIKNLSSNGSTKLVENQETKMNFVTKSIEQGDENKIFSLLQRLDMHKTSTINEYFGFADTDFTGASKITFLMKYQSNGSLTQAMKKNGFKKFPDTYKQIILCGVAHGMMTLHSHHILHTNLKPSNILIDENFYPHITDFSILSNPETDSDNLPISSAPYLAPEIIIASQCTPKSDVYSFGLIMYEIITGQKPFSNLTDVSNLMSKVVNGERPKFPKNIKPGLKQLIEQCWAEDQQERPTFKQLFNKLSMSFKDDEVGLDDDDDIYGRHFCLDGADYDKVIQYVEQITASQSSGPLVISQPAPVDQNKSLNEKVNELNETVQQLTEQVTSQQKENHKLRKVINDMNNLNEKVQQLTKQVKSQQEENQKLRDEIDDMNNTKPQLQQLQSQISTSKERTHTIILPPKIAPLLEEVKMMIDNGETIITIPSTVDKIPKHSFELKTTIARVNFPKTLKSIESSAFASCSSLDLVVIPSSVSNIGDMAFANCSSLRHIVISPRLKTIGDGAFSNCPKLDPAIRRQLEEKYGAQIF